MVGAFEKASFKNTSPAMAGCKHKGATKATRVKRVRVWGKRCVKPVKSRMGGIILIAVIAASEG
jgi:hypothetical protein